MARQQRFGAFRPKLITLAVASCFAASTALANPTGPQVVNGQAAILQNGNLLQITNTPNAIINWQSFSIGASEITRFIQQSQASAVLNRVTGSAGVINPSTILGALQSNGRVFLVNPSGILFGAGAQVDVAGLVATSLNLSNSDFLAGKLKFTDGVGAGSVVNQGNITAGQGGQVYLVGPAVTNNGIITSPNGDVVLAAGNSVELVNPGTPNLRVEITAPDNEARNLGQIVVDSGRAGIYAGLVNQSGTIRADSVVAEGGKILLKATKSATAEAGSVTSANGTTGGSVTVQSGDTTIVSGAVEAKGSQGKGGEVQILGNLVGLTGNASINASGDTGGGTVLVGGDFQGKNPDVQNAFRTYVGADTKISADAITTGDGGKVIVWSDDATRFYGTISAKGGAQSGDGGFAEVSGKGYLDFRGFAKLGAARGKSGTLLLDPSNVIINDVGNGSGDDGSFDGEEFFLSGPGPSLISWTTIKNQLDPAGPFNSNAIITTTGGQCSLGACGDITVATNSPDLATPNTLSLLAHQNIFVNGSITNSGIGGLTLVSGWDGIVATPDVVLGLGTINIANNISFANGTVKLITGNIIQQDVEVPGSITAVSLLADARNNSVILHRAPNSVGTLAGRSLYEFRFKNDRSLTIGSVGGVNGITVTGSSAEVQIEVTSGNLTVNERVKAASSSSDAASVTLTALAGSVTVTGATVEAIGGSGDGGGSATVTLDASNSILVDNATVRARGGDGSDGGAATVTLRAPGGITVQNSSGIEALGGKAFSSNDTAGNATIELCAGTLVSNACTPSASGAIDISNSYLFARGGDRNSLNNNGGDALVKLTAGSGGIQVAGTSTIPYSFGGSSGSTTGTILAQGGNGVSSSGASATVTLNTTGSITVGNATNGAARIEAIGGNADSNTTGGTGAVQLVAGSGGIVIGNGSVLSAVGGGSSSGGATGGNATVRLSSAGGITVNDAFIFATAGAAESGKGDALIEIRAAGAIDITGNGSDTIVADGRQAIIKIAGQGSESWPTYPPSSAAASISLTNARVRASGDGAEGQVHLLASGPVGVTSSFITADATGFNGEAQIFITSQGSGVSLTGSQITAQDQNGTVFATVNVAAGSPGISVDNTTVRAVNTSDGGAFLTFSSGGDVTILNGSEVYSQTESNGYAVTGIDAAGSIRVTDSTVDARSSYVLNTINGITGLRAGSDIILTGGDISAGTYYGGSLVGLQAGNNIQLGGYINALGSTGSSGWFNGYVPAELAAVIPDSFNGIGLNAGNQILGGGTGALNAWGNYALRAVNGIGTPAAPVRFGNSNFDAIFANNTGSSGDIALVFGNGTVNINNGTNLFNANPGGTYYVRADGGEGINLNTAFMPGGMNPGAGQTVHFKTTDTLNSLSGVALTGGGTGSITGAGQVTLEGGYFVNLAPGSSINAGNVLLKSDNMDIQGTVTAANDILIQQFTTSRTIELGGSLVDGALSLTGAELANLHALGLGIGTSTNTGPITVTGPIGPFNAFPNFLGSTISQMPAGSINSPGGLNAFAEDGIFLNVASNNIGTFGGVSGGDVLLSTTGNLGLGSVTAATMANFTSGGAIFNLGGPGDGTITAPTVQLAAATGIGQNIAPIFVPTATSVTATNSTSGDIALSQPNGSVTVGTGGWQLANAGGGYIVGGMNVTLNGGAPSSGSMFAAAANDVIVDPSGYTNSGTAILSGLHDVNVNGNLTANDLGLIAGNAVNINGAIAGATESVSVLATSLNITGTSTPAQLKAGTDLGIVAGEIVLQGGSGTGAFAELHNGSGAFDVFTVASPVSTGNIVINGGTGSGAYARIFGDPDVGSLLFPVSVGGVIQMDAGSGSGAYARIESASPSSIFVDFSTVTSGGFFVNGVENTVSSGSSGFFAGGQPAVLGQNLIVTYGGGGAVPDALPIQVQQAIDQLAAVTNNQTTLTDGNVGENELNGIGTGDPKDEKQKKALPICGK